jgi:aspartyl-tRNA(Asn)/glutamyl-tRNA(Gln) amidotransferase subunit A
VTNPDPLAPPLPPGPFTGAAIADLAGSLRAGRADPVSLVERALAAMEAAQPVINAFVTIDGAGARTAAGAAGAELRDGVDRGPLHGIPVAIKDIVDTAGVTTTMGARHFADHVPAADAEVVARLRAAGAVIVGKTTTHQYAYGPTGDRAANGAGGNPRDPGRMSGGSSAGSAAAVAAGLVPLAVGTDTGGSVRIPAALCGVVGLRPTFAGVPTTGVFPLSWSLDSVGPIAGSVADAALGYQVLAATAVAPLPAVPVAGLRFGVPSDAYFDRVDAPVREAVEALVAELTRRGATVRPVPVPDAAELLDLYRLVQSAEVVSVHRERVAAAPELFDPEVLARVRLAEQVPAWEYARALRRMGELRARAAARLDGHDALVLPTVPVLAPPIGVRDADIGGGWRSPRDALLAFPAPWGVLGVPAVSVPVGGFGAGELPIGAALVGAPGGDIGLMGIALAVEAVVRQYRQSPGGAATGPE